MARYDLNSPWTPLRITSVIDAVSFRRLQEGNVFWGHYAEPARKVPGTFLFGTYFIVEDRRDDGSMLLLAKMDATNEVYRIKAKPEFIPKFFDRTTIGSFGKDPKVNIHDSRKTIMPIRKTDPIYQRVLQDIALLTSGGRG